MSLEIHARDREGIALLDLEGRITAGAECTQLREAIRERASSGVQNVILNLGKVDYIDSTGLGALVICFTTLRKAGGKLKLLNASRRNIELLVFTKLATVFELFNDEQSAVNSFFPDRQIQRFDILEFIKGQTGQ